MGCAGVNPAVAGGVVGSGSAASCTNAALDAALSGGGTVTFDCGSAAATLVVNSEKTISVDTVIDGGNLVTLSGNNVHRIFNVQGGTNLTVKNLTLANGRTSGQGAAINSGYENVITVSHCKFLNNISTQGGEAGGGAIYSAIGSVTVDKSVFNGNKGSIGGAIRILNSNLNVTASTFINNQALDADIGSGGAIVIDGAKGDNGTIVVRGSKFTGNAAKSYGGAIFNNTYNNNKTTIANSYFSGNAVGGGSNGQGGAIWSNGDPAVGGHWIINTNNTRLTVTNTTMAGNTASTMGGGIFIAKHPQGASISRSTLSNNTASGMGGGVVQVSASKLSIINSTISGNKATGSYSNGGGVYVIDGPKVTITNSTIANNIANWDAGGILGDLNVTLKNTIVANNVALNGGNPWNTKQNCASPLGNGGNNLQFPAPVDVDCTAAIVTADPKLDALKNNGGPTQTRALLAGSAASRKGAGCPAVDQRGIARSSPAGTACDIGAFEASF